MRVRAGTSGKLAAVAVLVALSGTACGPQSTSGTAAPSSSTAATSAPVSSASSPAEAASPASAAGSTGPAAPTAKPPVKHTSKSAAQHAPKRLAKPVVAALMAPGNTGEQVRDLQHRLRQLGWFAGSITGTYGDATAQAVEGFQSKRGLTQTGRVDRGTWSALLARTQNPSFDERHNVLRAGPALLRTGSSGERVRQLQARLKQLTWFSGLVTGQYGPATAAAVRGFQGKRGIPVTGEVDQRTWERLVAMTRTPSSDEQHNTLPKPSATGLDPRCLTGRAICISKRTDSLVWVIDGKPQLRMDVRFGAYETPTREGSFAVGWKSLHHVSTIYHTAMPYAMFFSGGQAVHYSSDFAARGYAGASHGCVNVRNLAGIQALFAAVRVGDKVIVYR